jgi:hypothetical protein
LALRLGAVAMGPRSEAAGAMIAVFGNADGHLKQILM